MILMIFSAAMKTTGFTLSSYLARVGLSKAPEPDEDGLREVHAAQVFSVPFENLDIHLGRGVSLEPEQLVSKIIQPTRGHKDS